LGDVCFLPDNWKNKPGERRKIYIGVDKSERCEYELTFQNCNVQVRSLKASRATLCYNTEYRSGRKW
jgi:hypothetical protein